MLSKSFGPRCPEVGAKTQSGSTRRPPGVNQGAQTCQLDEWACLFGGNADSAQRQRNGIRTLCPFLSEGYKRGIQWPKKVNENGRFSLVNAGIAQLVEQLICNQQVVGSNPTAGSSLRSVRPLLSRRRAGSCPLSGKSDRASRDNRANRDRADAEDRFQQFSESLPADCS